MGESQIPMTVSAPDRAVAIPHGHSDARASQQAPVVVFSVASFEVTRIYGWPLDVSHLRSADDPRIIASSVGAYAGLMPVLLIVIGLIMRPLLAPLFESLLARWEQQRTRREMLL